MKTRNRRHFLHNFCGSLGWLGSPALMADGSRPKTNLVLIVADDLGYGDLGCYGQKRFSTPHLDRMAREGMRFTQHYSGCTVCAPSRSALMTGQHTGHTYIRGNKEKNPEGQEPLPENTVTLPGLLRKAGYRTGAFGKWGLGPPGSGGDPNRQGFDEFFGYNCQRLAHNYYPWHLWHNQEKVVLEENREDRRGVYAPDLIHRKALAFLQENATRPFFLFLPVIVPHAELFAPETYLARFRGKYNPEKSFRGTDSGPAFKTGGYGSQPEAHAAFAAMVAWLDEKVGEILVRLKELGLEENTLVLFSSDNGPHLEGGADPDYFDSNGPLRGYKRDLYEGGIRVPMLARWPGRIRPGSVSEHACAFWDWLPTICEAAGAAIPRDIDGISFLPELQGRKQRAHPYLYWEFHEGPSSQQAVTMGRWKGVRKSSRQPLELYDLDADIGETTDIAGRHAGVVETMQRLMKEARTESALWPFKP